MGKIYRPSVGYNYNSWRGTAARCRKERSNSNWITLFVFVRLQYATTVTDNLKKIEIMKYGLSLMYFSRTLLFQVF